MARHWIPAIISAALVASVPASAQALALIKQSNLLAWSTQVGHGTLKITAVDAQYFEADQTNDLNKSLGTIHMQGAILDGGHRVVLVQPGAWRGVWDGTASTTEITGKMTQGAATYTFKITAPAPVAAVVNTAPFLLGKTLNWSTTPGQNGTMHITATKGATFLVDQTNAKNAAAGIIKLDGEVKEGKVYLYNRKSNETWIGTATGGLVTGKVNNATPFTITAPASVPYTPTPEPPSAAELALAPFLPDANLTWSTSTGSGSFHVGQVKGTTFNLEQSNDKDRNQEANFISMSGELKGGKLYIYNKDAKETWIGTFANGVLTGKINDKTPFKVTVNQ